jgi:hypothetical protein
MAVEPVTCLLCGPTKRCPRCRALVVVETSLPVNGQLRSNRGDR